MHPMSNTKEVHSHNSDSLWGSALYSLPRAFWGLFKLHRNPSKWVEQDTQFTKEKTANWLKDEEPETVTELGPKSR